MDGHIQAWSSGLGVSECFRIGITEWYRGLRYQSTLVAYIEEPSIHTDRHEPVKQLKQTQRKD